MLKDKIPAKKKRWCRGDGEVIGGVIIMLILCELTIYLGSLLIVTESLNQLSKAAVNAGRSAAISSSLSDAQDEAERAAKRSVTSLRLGDVGATVEYAGDTSSWETGGYIKVTAYAYVETTVPLTSGMREKSVIVCIENGESLSSTYTGSILEDGSPDG